MRVVFLGTPTFAVPALRALLDHSYDVCAVITQPDRPSGRGQKLLASPIKVVAQKNGIQIFQPDRIRNEENREIFRNLRPDFIVTVAYGQIIPGWILQFAPSGAINIHASLLPRYRGAAPVAWAILRGETVTGITTMLMQEMLDSGPILLQQEVPISLTKTAGELSEDLSLAGASLLIKTLDGLKNDAIAPRMQDESQVSWAPRITKEMAHVSWENRALDIHNRIRAMNPWPVAYTDFRGERLHLWRSLPASQAFHRQALPGTFLELLQQGIRVQCGEGTALDLLEVQRPSKNRVSGRDFAMGARMRAGELVFH